jgi:hypothetical protein
VARERERAREQGDAEAQASFARNVIVTTIVSLYAPVATACPLRMRPKTVIACAAPVPVPL